MSKLVNYIKASYAELKKVDWPSKSQTTKHTILVVGISLFFAIFFTIMDKFLEVGLKQLVLLIK